MPAEVQAAFHCMKNQKAVEVDGVPIEVWKVLSLGGMSILTNIFYPTLLTGKIRRYWRLNYHYSSLQRQGICAGLWQLP